MARKGDMVAPTLSTLMSLHFRDHNDNRRVYTSDVKNANEQMPIHIVSMNKKCAQNIIQILVSWRIWAQYESARLKRSANIKENIAEKYSEIKKRKVKGAQF